MLIIFSPVLHQAHSVFQELDHLLVQASSWSELADPLGS